MIYFLIGLLFFWIFMCNSNYKQKGGYAKASAIQLYPYLSMYERKRENFLMPWNQSTIGADTNRRGFEIASDGY